MKSIYNILVIIDPKHDNSPVLARAKAISKVMEAPLHLLICRDTKKPKHVELLTSLVKSLEQHKFPITSEIAWHNNYHNTITTVQKNQNCGIVIKSHFPDNALKRAILTHDDWKLLRTCPCPILIVNESKSWKGRPMLAAVDLGNPNKSHVVLHNTLVRVANALTKVVKSNLHLVSVYPSPIFSEIHPDSKVPGMTPEIKEIYTTACKEYEQQYDALTKDNIHLVAGSPEIAIPRIAKQIDAAICVIGTVARTGISGVLIGNTAETILDDLTCDILVIKPNSISTDLEKLIQQIESE